MTEKLEYQTWLQETLATCEHAHEQIKQLYDYYTSPKFKKSRAELLKFQSGIDNYLS